MSTGSVTDSVLLEQLSALADGELAQADAAAACARWRGEVGVRASWHAYHLIGDVLRSEDLAAEPTRDEAFLQGLRRRLAREPVVIAPRALRSDHAAGPRGALAGTLVARSRWSWMTASAVTAGFFAVAGVYSLTRPVGPAAPIDTTLARADAPTTVADSAGNARQADTVAFSESIPQQQSVSIATGSLIRDPQLDAYLAAHKQFAGSSALGVPSAFLRSATVDAFGR